MTRLDPHEPEAYDAARAIIGIEADKLARAHALDVERVRKILERTAVDYYGDPLPQPGRGIETLANGLQRELGQEERGLADSIGSLGEPVDLDRSLGGGSDDIGDVSWNMPTVTLRFPANMPGGPGHNWANGIAMATPIAHKGSLAGAKVQALTLLDLLLRPEIVEEAWSYFNDVQSKEQEYIPFISDTDEPAIFLNEEIMQRYRPLMEPFYYDATRFDTYLEQLGIEYPTVREKPIAP